MDTLLPSVLAGRLCRLHTCDVSFVVCSMSSVAVIWDDLHAVHQVVQPRQHTCNCVYLLACVGLHEVPVPLELLFQQSVCADNAVQKPEAMAHDMHG